MKSEGRVSVSVIIPTYNAEDVVEGALRSVAEQGVEGVEVIVVDDASTDGTADAVRRVFSSSDFRLQTSDFALLQQTSNSGPAAARNRGIAEARGEWIAFLDADDTWLTGKLQGQMRQASEHPAIDLWCTQVDEKYCDQEWTELHLKDFITHNPIATSTVMVRKELVDQAAGFDENFSGAEDLDLWIRILASGGCRAGKLNRRLVEYNSEKGSLSMDERKFLPDALAVLDKAFAAEGALAEFQDQKPLALANQYWNASWMAFNRGSRADAMRLLCKGWRLGRGKLHRPWLRLFLRYSFGRK